MRQSPGALTGLHCRSIWGPGLSDTLVVGSRGTLCSSPPSCELSFLPAPNTNFPILLYPTCLKFSLYCVFRALGLWLRQIIQQSLCLLTKDDGNCVLTFGMHLHCRHHNKNILKIKDGTCWNLCSKVWAALDNISQPSAAKGIILTQCFRFTG